MWSYGWISVYFAYLRHFLFMRVHVCHFSKVLARKILTEPSKICAGVCVSGQKLTTTFVGRERECRKSLLRAHSEAALGLKRLIVPGAERGEKGCLGVKQRRGNFSMGWSPIPHDSVFLRAPPSPFSPTSKSSC